MIKSETDRTIYGIISGLHDQPWPENLWKFVRETPWSPFGLSTLSLHLVRRWRSWSSAPVHTSLFLLSSFRFRRCSCLDNSSKRNAGPYSGFRIAKRNRQCSNAMRVMQTINPKSEDPCRSHHVEGGWDHLWHCTGDTWDCRESRNNNHSKPPAKYIHSRFYMVVPQCATHAQGLHIFALVQPLLSAADYVRKEVPGI